MAEGPCEVSETPGCRSAAVHSINLHDDEIGLSSRRERKEEGLRDGETQRRRNTERMKGGESAGRCCGPYDTKRKERKPRRVEGGAWIMTKQRDEG